MANSTPERVHEQSADWTGMANTTCPVRLLTELIVGAPEQPFTFPMAIGFITGYAMVLVIGTPKLTVRVAAVVAVPPDMQLKIRSPAGSVRPVSVSVVTGVLATEQVNCANAEFDSPKSRTMANTGRIYFVLSILFDLLS